tara:strand:+ start:3368 stop:3928 length:561 start_codon:yes stop_codon:yes gene_type:complete
MMFSEAKVAQMAAFFLDKNEGRMPYLKLMKLLYLADRECLDRHGYTISDDRMVSMPHGPVLSRTYDLMKGTSQGEWDKWVADEANYEVSLRKPVDHEDEYFFLELSVADMEIMDDVYKQFGHMPRFDLRDYTHDHCQEWKDPHGGSRPITPYEIFKALGRSDDEARASAGQLHAQRQLSQKMADYL